MTIQAKKKHPAPRSSVLRCYNLNPEPPFNPDLNSLWNQQYLKPFLEAFQWICARRNRTLLPLDATQTSSGRNRQRKQCFQMLKGPPQPNLAGTAFHSQRDGTRCELVDLQTSSGRNRQRKQCFQMLKGPPSRTWLALPFTHNTMGRVVSLSICYVTFMDYNVPKRTNTLLTLGTPRYNGTIYFIYFGLSTTSEKKKRNQVLTDKPMC